MEPPEAAEARNRFFPFSFWRELSAAGSLVLASESDFETSNNGTVREQFCFKPQCLW